MKWLALILISVSLPATAKTSDWLSKYLKSKSIKCELSDEQLSTQVRTFLDDNIGHLGVALRARGSDFQSLEADRDRVDIGIFPSSPIYDFWVADKVKIVIQQYTFSIQTTTPSDDGQDPKVENSLWFPLHLNDPGAGKSCVLERVALGQDEFNLLPVVDLVYGEPPRVVASGLLQVMDLSATPTASRQLNNPPEKKVEEEKPRRKEVTEEKPRRRRQEAKDDEEEPRRRHRRYESRHYRRYRRHRIEQEAPAPAEAPPKQDECSGDVSPLRKALCAMQGK